MKEKAANQQNGGCTMEEEDHQEAMEEEEDEATWHQAHQEAHQEEETQFLPGPTCPLTFNPSPRLATRNPWENSPTSLMEIEPKQKRSLISLTIISCSISTSQDLTPRLKRSPSLSHLSRDLTLLVGPGHLESYSAP